MTTSAATIATTGNRADSAVVCVVVGPVGMVVGPVDGGDVVSEIEVGSAVGIPIIQNICALHIQCMQPCTL